MFETVSQGFRTAKNFLAGQRELSETNIQEALQSVRTSLLEADVEFGVVKVFFERVKEKALGQLVTTGLTTKSGKKLKLSPAEHFVGICYEELNALMGPVDTSIALSQPIGSIMMVGLQGSGKTTTTGKLAQFLIKKKHRPLLVAADIYRPAAIEQLKTLGKALDVPVFHEPGLNPTELCKMGMQKAKEWQRNVVIFDTAGRLAIDAPLMEELTKIKTAVKPDNIFLVVDAMIGQDAVRTAAEFHRRLSIDGFILTKLDGDSRGGAALSIKEVTGKPIKFLGVGEKLDNLEEFRPEGLSSRILGMGDIVGLAQDFSAHIDEDTAEQDAMRMLQGKFTLEDFLAQLKLIKKVGSVKDIMDKMPGMGDMIPKGQSVDDKEFVKLESIIHSMTKKERQRPEIIEKQRSRLKRIAHGSGHRENDVLGLLKRFGMMKQVMQAVGQQPGLLGKLPGFRQMGDMAKMAQAFNGLGHLGQAGIPRVPFATPQLSMASQKAKKDKRKREKQARKKTKRK